MAGRRFDTVLEYYQDLPSMPGDGVKISLQETARKCLGSLTNNGWSLRALRIEPTDKVGRYKLSIPLVKVGQRRFDPNTAQSKADQIADRVESRLGGWRRQPDSTGMTDGGTVDDKTYSTAELLKFPDDINTYFDHLYDRELQVREILKSIEIARDTDMLVRNHILLYGHKGVGKTEIGLTLQKIFGDLAVKRLDATSLTKAGAERLLLDTPVVPRVIILEELEKTAEVNLPWMLAVLDSRGELIKTTARMDVSRLVRSLVIAMVNDVDRLKTFQAGALYDRFSHRLYCPIPSEAIIRDVLRRDIKLVPGGKEAWIEPAIRYGIDHCHTYQIRNIRSIMMLGQDRLLSGEYQQSHDAMRQREQDDNAVITRENLA